MYELIINLHIHSQYSDGTGTHAEIAKAALATGLDAIIVTDHNVWVNGPEGYHQNGDQKMLLLVGEEIHDQARQPQKNHMLVFGANRELCSFANNPQRLIDQVRLNHGLAFIAHPNDPELSTFKEPDLSWVDWQVRGFTGIELWNGFSEFKSVIHSRSQALYYAYNPQAIAHGPMPETLKLWDRLTENGQHIVAVGGSDAHALDMHLGPVQKTVFPYEFHFRNINTHLLTSGPLSGNLEEDRAMIYDALRQGHAFVSNDLLAATRGFRFSAQGRETFACMGDEIPVRDGLTFQIHLPSPAECLLFRNGSPVMSWHNRENCTHITAEPGVYRVEVYLQSHGERRGWIYSNPIYVRG